jgi:hypothetical protein
MRGHSSRQFLAAEPVDEQRQMGSMLLDGAERKENDRSRISGELSSFGPSAFGERDHAGRRYRCLLSSAAR